MGADLNLMSQFYGVELGLKSTLSLVDVGSPTHPPHAESDR